MVNLLRSGHGRHRASRLFRLAQLSLSRLLDVVGRGTGPGARGRTRASRGERHGRGACPHKPRTQEPATV